MSQLRLGARPGTSRLLAQAAVVQMEQDSDLLGTLLALAYPDRIGQLKASSNRWQDQSCMPHACWSSLHPDSPSGRLASGARMLGQDVQVHGLQ